MNARVTLALVLITACGGKPAPTTPTAPKPYETFDVTMSGDGCIAVTRAEMTCEGTCNPPVKKVECPAGIVAGKTLTLVMAEDLTCSIDGASTPCPEHDKGPVTVPPEESEPAAPAP